MAQPYDFDKLANELHKRFYKNVYHKPVHVDHVNSIWAPDLVDMHDVEEFNKPYRYILMCIDVASRFAWAVPLIKKDAQSVLKAFHKIFDEAKATPKSMWCDKGSEFYNKVVQADFKKKDITTYSTFGENKSVMIERFNQTIKGWMYKEFTKNNKREWVNILPNLIKKYNNKIHTGIDMKPKDAYKLGYVPELIKPMNLDLNERRKFKVGDKVRIAKTKLAFEKGYLPNWTIELFTVSKVNDTVPKTYNVKDEFGEELQGSFYSNELQKSKMNTDVYLVDKVLKERKYKGKKQFYVQWLGYRPKANSWVNEEDMTDI